MSNQRPCRFYGTPGGCRAGRQCKFDHVAGTEPPTKPSLALHELVLDKTTPCKYFHAGHCRNGAGCAFAHVASSGEAPGLRSKTGSAPPSPRKSLLAESLAASSGGSSSGLAGSGVGSAGASTTGGAVATAITDSHSSDASALEESGGALVRLDDFAVLFKIGVGLVGQVFLVRHAPSRAKYAMKVISKDFVLSSNMLTHARSECQILRRVRHPYIVHLAFSFQTASKLILVMEFMPGGDMAMMLRRKVMLSEDAVRFYAAEVAVALLFLHQQNIMHRDLKCANILIDRTGHVRLTDFGFAKDCTFARVYVCVRSVLRDN